MSDFKPRLVIPSAGNKYYNIKSKGGYNPCIAGNYPYNSQHTIGYPGLTALPNCTGWATGRFNEIIGEKNCNYFGNTNARNYYALGIKQGLKVGKEPKLGACAVWDDGKYGHVGIVENILSDDVFIMSESGWFTRTPVWWASHRKGDGNWVNGTDYNWMKNYKWLGFVYNPAVKEEEDLTKAETEALIKAMVPNIVRQTITQIDKEKTQEPEDDWAKNAIAMSIAKDIMGGYPDGFHPQSNIRREEVAQVSENLQAYFKTIIQGYVDEYLKK